MRKMLLTAGVMMVAVTGAAYAQSAPVASAPAYNFGDHKSSTLTGKGWQALADKNLDAVLAYTNKCVDLYGAEAVKMQTSLKAYPADNDAQIFSFWALNDVATSLYIQGEAYRQAKQMDKAKAAFDRIVKEFTFGQAFDPANKTFWKPADAAKDKLDMMSKGLDLDFGNMSSATIVQKLWEALNKKDLDGAVAYYSKLDKVYGEQARKMQSSMTEPAWESPEKIHSFWALNDVGTGTFILGEAYRIAGKTQEALTAYKKTANEFLYAQCWDTNGWFWKPAEAAQQKIVELEAVVSAETKK
jgi:tetratricopeptide (TPR) repeat protein